MINYWNALVAEGIKLRRTLASRMCWIAPFVVVTLYMLLAVTRGIDIGQTSSPREAWLNLANACWGLWSFLMLPLFITLQSALLAGLEHSEHQWKHLLALSMPKSVHYTAKWVLLLLMLLVALLALVIFIEIAGYILAWLRPAFGISGVAPHGYLLEKSLRVFAASTLIIAIHTWIAIRWRSFTVAVATGMTATVISFLVGQSVQYGRFYPWAMPVQVFAHEGVYSNFVVVVGLVGGFVVFILGLWDFNRRDIS